MPPLEWEKLVSSLRALSLERRLNQSFYGMVARSFGYLSPAIACVNGSSTSSFKLFRLCYSTIINAKGIKVYKPVPFAYESGLMHRCHGPISSFGCQFVTAENTSTMLDPNLVQELNSETVLQLVCTRPFRHETILY